MARPKKNEGGAIAPAPAVPAAPNTTPAEGVSTTPEATVVEPIQADGTTIVTPSDSAVDQAALPAEVAPEQPVVPPSQREEGTTALSTEEPLPVVARAAEQVELAATPIPEGLGPVGMTLEDLDSLGIPRPGARLTCASFENGQPVAGTVLSLSEELDVARVLLDGLGWRWPVPTGRIDGSTWTHDPSDYPPPGKVPAFDADARRAPETPRLEEPDSERAPAVPAAPVVEEAPVVAAPAPVPAQPRKPSAAQVALGIPEHYIRCRINGLGSISGHGLNEEGKPSEQHLGGRIAYFTTATVQKLGHMLDVLED